jgi:hypothetical protein
MARIEEESRCDLCRGPMGLADGAVWTLLISGGGFSQNEDKNIEISLRSLDYGAYLCDDCHSMLIGLLVRVAKFSEPKKEGDDVKTRRQKQ